MSDWDASDSEDGPSAPAAPAAQNFAKKRWDDEDAEDEGIKDSWSASEDEADGNTVATTGPAPPVRQKGITKQKIAEKEAAERARSEARAQQTALDADPAERRRREQAQQLKSDMENVAGLFGTATTLSGSEDLMNSNPRSKEDFDALAAHLAEQLASRHGSKPFYAHFVEQLARHLCEPLKDLDVRKASSTLATLANEKQKAQRDAAAPKKKSKKPGLGTIKAAGTGGAYDTRVYDEALDDYGAYDGASGKVGGGRFDDDDFM